MDLNFRLFFHLDQTHLQFDLRFDLQLHLRFDRPVFVCQRFDQSVPQSRLQFDRPVFVYQQFDQSVPRMGYLCPD